MPSPRAFISVIGASAVTAMLAMPSSVNAGDVHVDIYRPPVYVAPPAVVVKPVYAQCAWRTVRVWTGYRYVVRTVRHCW